MPNCTDNSILSEFSGSELCFDGSHNHVCDGSHNHTDCSGNNICVDLALLSQSVPNTAENTTSSIYYLQPIYIQYCTFHKLFFYNNGKFTPNTQLESHPNYECYIENKNQYVKTTSSSETYSPFDLYNILKTEFMSGSSQCWDVCSKIEFEKKIAKIKTLFDVQDLCSISCSLTLDELFLSLEANGVVIDQESGMPDIHHHSEPPCVTINITTKFSNSNHSVEIIWPFFVDLSFGFDCSDCGESSNSRYRCNCCKPHHCEAIIPTTKYWDCVDGPCVKVNYKTQFTSKTDCEQNCSTHPVSLQFWECDTTNPGTCIPTSTPTSYITKTHCEQHCPHPALPWACDPAHPGKCKQDPYGPYATESLCEQHCPPSALPWACDPANPGKCKQTPHGPYATESLCEQYCPQPPPPQTYWKCDPNNPGNCISTTTPTPYTKKNDCLKECICNFREPTGITEFTPQDPNNTNFIAYKLLSVSDIDKLSVTVYRTDAPDVNYINQEMFVAIMENTASPPSTSSVELRCVDQASARRNVAPGGNGNSGTSFVNAVPPLIICDPSTNPFICFNMKPLTLEYTVPQPDKEYFLGVWFPEGSTNAILSGYVDDQNIQFYKYSTVLPNEPQPTTSYTLTFAPSTEQQAHKIWFNYCLS